MAAQDGWSIVAPEPRVPILYPELARPNRGVRERADQSGLPEATRRRMWKPARHIAVRFFALSQESLVPVLVIKPTPHSINC